MSGESDAVLVTGAAGFVGSTLSERLISQGRRVVGLDNFDDFYPREKKERNLSSLRQSADFHFVEADLRDAESLDRALRGERFGGVVHLAALAGVRPSIERPDRYADVNVRGTAVLANFIVKSEIPNLVFASSSSVYGERSEGPFRETDPVERPISPYAATKRAGELLLNTFCHVAGTHVTCARIFTAFGPRQRPDLAIRKFAERMIAGQPIPIYGDGSALRDFTYVDDLVTALTTALERFDGFRIINLGAGRPVTVLDVVRQLERSLGVSARIEWSPPQPGDVSKTWADIGLAQELLDYQPRVSIDEGIDRFANWLRDDLKRNAS